MDVHGGKNLIFIKIFLYLSGINNSLMTLDDFKQELTLVTSEQEETIFVQKFFFNGTPFIFKDRDSEYYMFAKKIADNFNINYTDINIVGSSRFGFSPFKFTEFTYDSDVDVAICNEVLFEKYFKLICDYTYMLRANNLLLRKDQYDKYIRFLKYFSTGWMRPDLLPKNTTEFREIKENWDDFFLAISYDKSEVGNYKVKAGLFKSQYYAEKYYKSSISIIKSKIST